MWNTFGGSRRDLFTTTLVGGEFAALVEFVVDGLLESDTLVNDLEGLAARVIEEEIEKCWSEDRPLTEVVVGVE